MLIKAGTIGAPIQEYFIDTSMPPEYFDGEDFVPGYENIYEMFHAIGISSYLNDSCSVLIDNEEFIYYDFGFYRLSDLKEIEIREIALEDLNLRDGAVILFK